jgi:hypothetical protein
VGKKKPPQATEPKSAPKNSAKLLGKPDISVLEKYNPTNSSTSHPEWVKANYPSYISGHVGHEMTSVREFSHAGHALKITTTYQVEVDGQPVNLHLSVDEDGQVHTHATPFVTYGSALDLIKAVLDAYPGAFASHGHHPGHHSGHHSHAHGESHS